MASIPSDEGPIELVLCAFCSEGCEDCQHTGNVPYQPEESAGDEPEL